MARGLVRLLTVTALLGAMVVLATPAGAGGGGAHCKEPFAEGRGTEVALKDSCFSPSVLYAEPGDTITWTNQDPYPHAVAGTGGSWGTFADIPQGGSVTVTFDEAGFYPYTCYLHPGMNGVVVVGEPKDLEAIGAGTPSGIGGSSVAPPPAPEESVAPKEPVSAPASTQAVGSVPSIWRTIAIVSLALLVATLAGGFALLSRRRLGPAPMLARGDAQPLG